LDVGHAFPFLVGRSAGVSTRSGVVAEQAVQRAAVLVHV
jgi:hypothetical protein